MKSDIFVSYVTQAYISLIGLVLMPIYLKYLGVEAFGLVGLSITMQALVQLLDLGLAPSLSRQMSLYRAGTIDGASLRSRLHTLEWLLGAIALVAFLVFALSRNVIVRGWLQFERLSADEVSSCLIFMVVAAFARWLAGMYRAGLVGLERQKLVNGGLAVFATLRFVGVVPLLIYFSIPPLGFFAYQALVGVCELLCLVAMLYRTIPRAVGPQLPDAGSLRAIFPTAGAMAFLSVIWIVVTHMDRIILSRILSLEAFGYYSIAVLAAGSVTMLVPPLHQVLQPRITILVAQQRHSHLSQLYCTFSQLCSVAVSALGGGLALFAEPILWAWTGSHSVATGAAPILFWYGLANALMVLLVLPFMLQFALGYLRLHVLGNIVLIAILLPTLVWAAFRHGGVGTGIVLFAGNLFFLLFWVPLVYRKLAPELTWSWLWVEVLPSCAAAVSVLGLGAVFGPVASSRFEAAMSVAIVLAVSVVAGVIAGRRTRELAVKSFSWKSAA